MLIGWPVKLVMPRGQIFHNASFRPRSRHHVTVGAGSGGRIAAIRYDVDHQQSRKGQFPPSHHESVPHSYGVANHDGTTANVRVDTQDPAYMRAPHPSHFAFESAVDELAYKIDQEPVAFRLAHQATVDPIHNQAIGRTSSTRAWSRARAASAGSGGRWHPARWRCPTGR